MVIQAPLLPLPLPLPLPSCASLRRRGSSSALIRSPRTVSDAISTSAARVGSIGFFVRSYSGPLICPRRFCCFNVGTAKASVSGTEPSSSGDEVNDMLEQLEVKSSNLWKPFLGKLVVALGIAATVSILSIYFKWPASGSSFRLPVLVEGSSQSYLAPAPVGFTFTLFGHRVIIPERTPGWVYFWLLMAAGCGLFISEEALNIWVGISLARTLSLESWQSLTNSFSANASYIVSTVLWVYWGVCISDMVPFYLGKLFRQTKASQDILTKVGIGKEKAVSITRVVQKYGNLIGFVERFSLGVRNPTAFLAGAWGISPECFFAGVCFGGLITLSVQLAIGFLVRDRPVVALASVAAAVGIWTLFPYLIAASTALFLFLRQNRSS
ncbi:uncharacterized protein [Typha angustifolia]|uniref:uncharacterized protein n=1 Tax=Typha angustifolia TaxID=59011 RepID=UPI003C2DE8FD